MREYTSYGFEFLPSLDTPEVEIVLVLPAKHKDVVELTKEDLLYMLSVLRSRGNV